MCLIGSSVPELARLPENTFLLSKGKIFNNKSLPCCNSKQFVAKQVYPWSHCSQIVGAAQVQGHTRLSSSWSTAKQSWVFYSSSMARIGCLVLDQRISCSSVSLQHFVLGECWLGFWVPCFGIPNFASKTALASPPLLSPQDLKKAGLLIFANKQDVKECMTVAEISQFLKLTSIKDHQWHIQACCALTGEG